MSYLEIDKRYEEDEGLQTIRREVHRFAEDVLRPASRKIDGMDAEEYEDPESGGWDLYRDVLKQMKELGYHRITIPEELGGDPASALETHVVLEELGWGSSGFAVAIGVDGFPALFAGLSLDEDLMDELLYPYVEDEEGEIHGCWAVTEPAHGSEFVQSETLLDEGLPDHLHDNVNEPDFKAEKDGGEWILNGMKSSWVSCAPMATHAAVHANMDPADGSPGHLFVVPLDRPGVSRGNPIQKIGQRDCPQGELVFDGVRLSERYRVLGPEELSGEKDGIALSQILCVTSAGVGAISTGLARAAFEEALKYARERKQGGKRICDHQLVKKTLYDMYEKVETARAYSRRAYEHVYQTNLIDMELDASYEHAVTAQIYCKQIAYDVAHQALQIHGANGITKDYPVEQLFRDARVKLIEDGTVDVLSLEAAEEVIENYEI